MPDYSRRAFTQSMMALAAMAASPVPLAAGGPNALRNGATPFRIALASWSFHMPLWRGQMKAADLARRAATMEVDALEWSAKTFRDLRGGRELMYQVPPAAFFEQLRRTCDSEGVRNRVLSVGGPYYLSTADKTVLRKALDFYRQYVEPARQLGCDILRAELYCDLPDGPGREEEAKKRAMEGLHALLDATSDSGLTINVENHHGISSRPEWLADLVRSMNHPRLGLTADINNFRTDLNMPYDADPDQLPRYEDRYSGLETLLPLANWMSAKTYAFDQTGYEISINYPRIVRLMRDSGYSGYMAVEYEGAGEPEEGVRQSVAMLRKLQRHFG